VVLLNGAAEAFWLLAQVLRPELAVVVVHPSPNPRPPSRRPGTRCTRVWRDPDSFHLDLVAVPAKADLVVTGNPNNPTATLDPAATLAGLARPGRVLVVDEAFMEFTPGETETLAGRRDLPGVVVVRSLTKLWGLADIRVGYLLAPPHTTQALRAARQPWSVNSVACAALVAWANHGAEYAAHLVQRLVATREQLAAALAARGIAVRPCHSFSGLTANHLRVAVRDPADNQQLVDALAETLDPQARSFRQVLVEVASASDPQVRVQRDPADRLPVIGPLYVVVDSLLSTTYAPAVAGATLLWGVSRQEGIRLESGAAPQRSVGTNPVIKH
jgi:histidinol-phosphate aminotransferase